MDALLDRGYTSIPAFNIIALLRHGMSELIATSGVFPRKDCNAMQCHLMMHTHQSCPARCGRESLSGSLVLCPQHRRSSSQTHQAGCERRQPSRLSETLPEHFVGCAAAYHPAHTTENMYCSSHGFPSMLGASADWDGCAECAVSENICSDLEIFGFVIRDRFIYFGKIMIV